MLIELFSFLTPPLLLLQEEFLAFFERPFYLLALGDVTQENEATSDSEVTILMVQGRDTQVKEALGLTCTHNNLFMNLCYVVAALDELRPGRENLGNWLPD